MIATVKNKIWLGTVFLFLLLLLTGGTGIYYIATLKAEGKDVLKNNYESLQYAHAMQAHLQLYLKKQSTQLHKFEQALQSQENNITEPGEAKATNGVRTSFNKLQTGDSTAKNVAEMEQNLQTILSLNMHALGEKNKSAEKTAEDALLVIITLGTMVFLIGLTFLVNFPSIVTTPISKLTEAIREIASKNYKHRIHVESKDEFEKLADAFNDMAERLEFFESSNLNKLMFEKTRAEAVINSLKDASVGVDKNDLVLFANYQALQLLGMEAEDIVGKPVAEIKSRNDLFAFLIENESTTPFKIVVENRENYFVKEVIEVAQGDTTNRVIVIKNITSFKELDVAKTNFIATVSHELKTPLASSDFGLKLLEDERVSKLTDEQKELIGNLKQDNQRMLKILSELLNMSQVEAGRIELNIQKVHPQSIIENAIKAVAASAKEKEIKIKTIFTGHLTDIAADADKTTWVLSNFLTNAIKYSFSDSIVEVSAFLKNGNVIFSVKDDGPGIEAAYLPRLFERYFQVPGSREKGTGLGLAISKEFVDAQLGKIWVDSEIGKGSVFYFQLPVKVS